MTEIPVRVAVAAPLDQPLTYLWPFIEEPRPGLRVAVQLGRRRAVGYLLGPDPEPPEGVSLRPVTEILDHRTLFPPEMLDLFFWLAEYYRFPLGQTIGSALPSSNQERSLKPKKEKLGRALPVEEEPTRLGKNQALLWEFMAEKDWLPFSLLRRIAPGADQSAEGLVKRGLMEIEYREIAARTGCLDEECFVPERPTPEQAAALEEIDTALESGRFNPFLLHGVTGSGKTEVYLRAGRKALELGRTALILVPEIALTPRLTAQFKHRFGDSVAVLHSSLTQADRVGEWLRVLDGRAKVALGARSAVFAPLTNLGLIVVDEEHEPSYKQEEGLRYHARDVALVRGRSAGATVILGSATPSVVSFHHQDRAKYRLLALTERVMDRPLPTVETVDLRDEEIEEGRFGLFSQRLIEATRETLAGGRQALYFLNRRGYATYPVCGKCGRPFVCDNCSVTMTFHDRFGALICHYCGSASGMGRCERCDNDKPKLLGVGTERIETEAAELFPEARIARLDSDVPGGFKTVTEVLGRLGRGEIDILIGTQMLAKGHDFPGIGLVGVILADQSLALPDFRAAERTFQLLTQVAGRSGRGDDPGRVIVQTFNPDHYSLAAAAGQDYQAFFDEEIRTREMLFYPPFSRLIQIRISGPDGDRVEEAATRLAGNLNSLAGALSASGRVNVLGPAPAPIIRIRNQYRWRVLIKAQTATLGRAVVDRGLAEKDLERYLKGLKLVVDVDPMSMM